MSDQYKVEQEDGLNPDNPVIFELEVFGDGLTPILYQSQPGPWPFFDQWDREMFIELETLVKLGEFAAEALRKQADE